VKYYLSFLVILASTLSVKGSEIKIESLKTKIQSFETSAALNQYLVDEDLISELYFRRLKNCMERDETTGIEDSIFHPKKVVVEGFEKDLFGDQEKELVLQIRQATAKLVNVFYLQNGNWQKVPGQVETEFAPCMANHDLHFTFSFIDIKPNGKSNLLFTQGYMWNLTTTIKRWKIWEVTHDTMYQVVMWQNEEYLNRNNGSGSSTYYTHRLIANPSVTNQLKVLELHATTSSIECEKWDDKNCKETQGESITEHFFKIENGLLKLEQTRFKSDRFYY
jgi:hypothetical protein